MDEKLKELKEKYETVPLPEDLHQRMVQTVAKHKSRRKFNAARFGGAAAAAVICLGVLVNVNPAAYEALAAMPVIGSLVEVITFTEFSSQHGASQLEVKVPAVTGLNDTELQQQLNEEFYDDGYAIAKAYEQDLTEFLEGLEEGETVNYSVDANYEVLTNDERILSVAVTTTYTQASAMEVTNCYTVDKQQSSLLTLTGLFAEDSGYEEQLRREVLNQMAAEMAVDDSKTYFTEEVETAEPSFYIDSDHRLVIVYDEYLVAPGFMGSSRFTIETEAVTGLLSEQGAELIK